MAASAPLPARRSGRGRRASTAIGGLLLVVAAGATAGWLVQRGSVAAIAAAAQSVVGIRVDFGGDRSGTALGLAVGPSGQIAVAYSSVNGAESIEVHVAGRAGTLLASVAGLDPTDDLALLQLQNAPRLPAVSLGTPSPPFVGDSATAIGAPTGGGTPAVSEGSITGLDQTVITRDSRSDAFATLTGVIGFSGPLSSADDGGALISGSGQLVGMILAGSSQLWPARSISAGGVALPVRTLAAIAHDMETGTPNPRVLRAGTTVLGVDTQDNASPPGGALVVAVEFVSPAQAAGITPGDVITGVGGSRVTSSIQLSEILKLHQPGERVEVDWLTPSGQPRHTLITLSAGVAR